MLYLSTVFSNFSTVLNFANFDFEGLLHTNMAVTIAESTGVVATVAGIVSIVASTVFKETEYFYYGLIASFLGFGLWNYAKEFRIVYDELKRHLSLDDAAEQIKKEDSEMHKTVQKLQKETDRLELSTQKLKEESTTFSNINEKLEKQNGELQKEQEEFQVLLKRFEQLKAELSVASEKLERNVEEDVKEIEDLKGIVEETKKESLDKTAALEERLRKVAEIYEKTLHLDQIRVEWMRLTKEQQEEFSVVLPSLKTIGS